MRLHIAEDTPDKLTIEGTTFTSYAAFEKWFAQVAAAAKIMWPWALDPSQDPPGDTTGSKKDGG